MSTPQDSYRVQSQKTAVALQTIAASPKIAALSRLTLPEIESITQQIAQVVPAGNVPGLILSGLARLEGRQVPRVEQQRHLGMLFRGVRNLLDKAVYGALFAGPAAIIVGYQKLLQLAGKDIDAAFPDGTWQFYLEFALREDTARHANETTGFHAQLLAHNIVPSEADQLAAWVMASIITLQTYPRLLENEWRERVYTTLLKQACVDAPQASTVHNIYNQWEEQRPYQRRKDAGNLDYPDYRRTKFDQFLLGYLEALPEPLQADFRRAIGHLEQTDSLPAYIAQMDIRARLEPGTYQETRHALDPQELSIGVIFHGSYMVIPLIDPVTNRPVEFETLRRIAAGIVARPSSQKADEITLALAHTTRSEQVGLRAKTDAVTRAGFDKLSRAPILINWDRQDARLPLASIRQAQRGVGDHALTLFFTDESVIFDQSHIFFDGAWGAALAEIMTSEALSWARYFVTLPSAVPSSPEWMSLQLTESVLSAATAARLPAEACAENTTIFMNQVIALRRYFKMRSDLLNVTVNDLLILYRTLHGQVYQPGVLLRAQLQTLETNPDAKRAVQAAIEKYQKVNPSILIPMDASQQNPRERLYPTTFRNPVPDFWQRHQNVLVALREYQSAGGDRQTAYQRFDEQQRYYLSMIASFGVLMRKHKEIALSGQSTSTASIKMLAWMPDVIQQLLDEIPGRFDVLNEVIKGEEVFSNVGRVAKGSTLRRFITAKDDNQQKTLAWGVLTDDQNIVHLALRDFRPHVTLLAEIGQSELANLMTQDLLNSYAEGFNAFIRELREITAASRETQLSNKSIQ